jgi:hypothetical protein
MDHEGPSPLLSHHPTGVSNEAPTFLVKSQIDQQQLAKELVDKARADGVDLVGPDGGLTGLTKSVLESALEAEMSEHLGYDKHEVAGRDGGNSRNGTRPKTVLTEVGPVEIEVPRDRASSFAPQLVRKRQRRLDGIDQIVLSVTARGLTTGEVAAHFAEVYGAKVSKDTISRISDKVLEEMSEWCNRPLDRVYPVIFIDAIVVKIRDGQVGCSTHPSSARPRAALRYDTTTLNCGEPTNEPRAIRHGWPLVRMRFVRRRPTLPHCFRCSTIGAGGLSFRVRDVSGRFPSAVAAVTL